MIREQRSYVIIRGANWRTQKYYMWNEAINDVQWVPDAFRATAWPNKRDAEKVAVINGGRVIPRTTEIHEQE